MKTAVLAFTNPLTRNRDGGKFDISSRIKALNSINSDIDLYCITKKSEQIDENLKKEFFINCHNNLYMDLPQNNVSNLFYNLPISVSNKYSEKFSQILKNNKYDVCIYEGEHMYKYRYKKAVNSILHIIRMHDIESTYRKQLSISTKSKAKALLQYNDSIKYKGIENKIINNFDGLFFISKDEQNVYKNLYPNLSDKLIWMPPSVKYIKDLNYNNSKKNTILYFGDLSVSNNLDGINWFIKKVYPYIIKKNSDLYVNIIGNINEKNKKELQCGKNIQVLGYVENINKYIDEASLIICPIFNGAGVKIKLVESLGKGKIVVATNKAVEGTSFIQGKHLLLADDENLFANYCNNVLNDQEKYYYLVENSIEEIRSNYSIESQANTIFDFYKENIKKQNSI